MTRHVITRKQKLHVLIVRYCKIAASISPLAKIWNWLKIREGASRKPKGSPRRKKEVIAYQELGYEKWAKEKEYGMRWKSTEGIFSAKKRIFGETVRATKKRNMYHEVRLKYWFYNKLQEIT